MVNTRVSGEHSDALWVPRAKVQKMDSKKDRNGMDLTDAEDTKKRWQEYMEELYKKRSSRPR